MKKIAIAMALCVSASFSPALAQYTSRTVTTGTPANVTVTTTVRLGMSVSGRPQLLNVSRIILNGTDLRVTDPNIMTQLGGASCTHSAETATCTK